VDVGPGEVANRVVTVGTASRAALLAGHLDGAEGTDPKVRPALCAAASQSHSHVASSPQSRRAATFPASFTTSLAAASRCTRAR